MKVGNYVRTYDGVIGKIIDDNFAQEEKRYELDYNNKLYYFQQIVKSSQNIIDLIEVGDYVDGLKITLINEPSMANCNKRLLYAEDEEGYLIKMFGEEDIKSIVTKEQFSSIEYKVN